MTEDVDKEYKRLKEFMASSVVQEPTTMPWGNKSFLLRDPDGNLINFLHRLAKNQLKNMALYNTGILQWYITNAVLGRILLSGKAFLFFLQLPYCVFQTGNTKE